MCLCVSVWCQVIYLSVSAEPGESMLARVCIHEEEGGRGGEREEGGTEGKRRRKKKQKQMCVDFLRAQRVGLLSLLFSCLVFWGAPQARV